MRSLAKTPKSWAMSARPYGLSSKVYWRSGPLKNWSKNACVEHVLEVHQETRAAELSRLGAAVEHVGQRTPGDHRGQGRKVLAERDEIALDLDAGILGLESGDGLVPIGSSGDVGGLPAHHVKRGLGQRGVNGRGEQRCGGSGDESFHDIFSLNVALRSVLPTPESHELRNALRVGAQRGGSFRSFRP